MRNQLLFSILIFLTACKSLQVSTEKTTKNTPTIGIEWSHGERVQSTVEPSIDSVINGVMERFNSEKHAFNVIKKEKKQKDFISMEFREGRIVGKGGKIAGYTISAIGLIALPATILVLTEAQLFLAAYYFPEHRVFGGMELGGTLGADKGYKSGITSSAGALFARDSKQLPKMYKRLDNSLYNALLKIENQLKANETVKE